MPKIVVYVPDYNQEHQMVLKAFASSIPGAIVKDARDYEECDIAVIYGAKKNAYQATWPKGEILARHSGRRLIMVESAFVKRGEYWQIGWGGQAGHAYFCERTVPFDRWESFGIPLKPWRYRHDGPIVICGQLPRDTQVQDVDFIGWVKYVFSYYQERGLKVMFRPHPMDKDPHQFGIDAKYLDFRTLEKTLDDARCLVTFNSTSAVDGIIAGVPTIVADKGSIAHDIAQNDIDDVFRLEAPDRTVFCSMLGYSQWSLDEIKEGLAWRHLSGQ
jgi:hypothetical protein